MALFRKRKFTSTFRRNVRGRMGMSRRRTRGNFRRRGRTNFTSGQLGNVSNIGWRTKRVSRSRWRRMLWQSTLFTPHYRSVLTSSAARTVPASIDLGIMNVSQAIVNNFWTAGGGAILLDAGVALPTFRGDITLRGGVSKMWLSNDAAVDAVRAKIYLIWTNHNPDAATLTSLDGTTVEAGFDPSMVPDFMRSGKVIKSYEYILLPGQKPVEVLYRYKIRKIDQAVHNANGEQLFWMTILSQMSNVDGGTQSVVFGRTHNVSFTGDGT